MRSPRGCLLLVACGWSACQQAPLLRPPEPIYLQRTTESALRSGNWELADETIQRALQIYPDDADLTGWAAVLDQMLWRHDRALGLMRGLHSRGDYGALGRGEVMGRIGELLFRRGEFAKSRSFLSAGSEGSAAERRAALAALTRELPFSRREPTEFTAELPLVEGALPQLLCTIGDLQRSFVLDTGASVTALTTSLADDLHVGRTFPAGLGRDGADQNFAVAFGVLSSLTLGSFELGDVPVLVLEDEQLKLRDPFGGESVAPRGVLGFDVLSRFRVTFDSERRSVIFELPRGLDIDRSDACVQFDGRCLVPVQIEGRRLWFVLDTGASHSSLTSEGLDALPEGTRRSVSEFRRVRSPGGLHHVVRQVQDLSVTVGEVRFGNVDLPIVMRPASNRFPVHGVLGSDLLMLGRVTYDGGRLRVQAFGR